MSESTSAESTNTVDADDTGTMTASEEKEAQDLQAFQHFAKSIGDKDGKTPQVLQHAGVNEQLGFVLHTDRELDEMCIKNGKKEIRIPFHHRKQSAFFRKFCMCHQLMKLPIGVDDCILEHTPEAFVEVVQIIPLLTLTCSDTPVMMKGPRPSNVVMEIKEPHCDCVIQQTSHTQTNNTRQEEIKFNEMHWHLQATHG